MRALTLWQPMAWAIAHGHKPVENRIWPLPLNMIGQTVAIHAGMQYSEDWARMIRETMKIDVPSKQEIERGCVVCVVTFAGCLDDAIVKDLTRSQLVPFRMVDHFDAILKWYSGPYGFLCRDVRRLVDPVPCRGFQGFWGLDAEIEARVREQLPDLPPRGADQMSLHDLDDQQIDEMAKDSLRAMAMDAAELAIHHERRRCLEIVRRRASYWSSSGASASSIVTAVLEAVANEIEGVT